MNQKFISLIFILIFQSLLFAASPSDFGLNIYNPLILDGSRSTGMGGAVVSLGDSPDDLYYNIASSSLRNKFQKDWFEWDYTFLLANLISKSDIDFRNAKDVATYNSDDLSYLSVALMAQFGTWSFSLTVSTASITIIENDLNILKLNEQLTGLNIANEVIKDRLFIGLGVSGPTFELKDQNENTLVKYDLQEGADPNWRIGAIYHFKENPLSLGLDVRFNSSGAVNLGTKTAGIELPKEIRHPFTLTLGGSWKVKYFKNNTSEKSNVTTSITKKEKKIKKLKRWLFKPEYLLVSADLALVGKVENAVDVLSFTGSNSIYRSGESRLVQPRIGAEVSFPDWLKIRVGYYFEGARISGTHGRHHATFNIEASLFELFGFDIATAFSMDVAPNFWSIGLGMKVWNY